MADALTALLKAHAAERDARAKALDRRVEAALQVADEIENNGRAALGMELNQVIANQNHLEHAVRQLRAQVGALAKQSAAYGKSYAGLVKAVGELGSPEPFLTGTAASLERINGHFEFVAGRLTSE